MKRCAGTGASIWAKPEQRGGPGGGGETRADARVRVVGEPAVADEARSLRAGDARSCSPELATRNSPVAGSSSSSSWYWAAAPSALSVSIATAAGRSLEQLHGMPRERQPAEREARREAEAGLEADALDVAGERAAVEVVLGDELLECRGGARGAREVVVREGSGVDRELRAGLLDDLADPARGHRRVRRTSSAGVDADHRDAEGLAQALLAQVDALVAAASGARCGRGARARSGGRPRPRAMPGRAAPRWPRRAGPSTSSNGRPLRVSRLVSIGAPTVPPSSRRSRVARSARRARLRPAAAQTTTGRPGSSSIAASASDGSTAIVHTIRVASASASRARDAGCGRLLGRAGDARLDDGGAQARDDRGRRLQQALAVGARDRTARPAASRA